VSDRTIEETDYFLLSLPNVIGAVIVNEIDDRSIKIFIPRGIGDIFLSFVALRRFWSPLNLFSSYRGIRPWSKAAET